MDCSVCFNTLEDNSFIKLPCNCDYNTCSDCLTNWIVTQIEELHYEFNEKIPCMNYQCKQAFLAHEVVSSLTKDQQDQVDKALLSVYLKKTADIRKCPNNLCNYAGTIDLSKSCHEKLECEKCSTNWRDKAHYSKIEKVKEFLTESDVKTSEMLSGLWEEIFTRRCPNCGVCIERNGGCDHMTCKRCQFEFCWLCAQIFSQHNRRTCNLGIFVRALILCMTVINLLWILGVTEIIFTALISLFGFILKAAVLNALAFALVNIFSERKRILFFIYLIAIITLGTVTIYFEIYFGLLRIAVVEMALLLLVVVYDKNLRVWVTYVF